MPEAQTLFQTVNPDGSVTFSFTGKINALGVDLPAANTETPPPANFPNDRISWVDTDGGLAAYIIGSNYNLTGVNDGKSLILASANPSIGESSAHIELQSHNGGSPTNSSSIIVDADNANRLLLDSFGNSDFLIASSLVNISNFNQAPGFNIIGTEVDHTNSGSTPVWNAGSGLHTVQKTGLHFVLMNTTANNPTSAYQVGILNGASVVARATGQLGGFWEQAGTACAVTFANKGAQFQYRYLGGPNPLNFTGGNICAAWIGSIP